MKGTIVVAGLSPNFIVRNPEVGPGSAAKAMEVKARQKMRVADFIDPPGTFNV
jgi:hypothetical protein